MILVVWFVYLKIILLHELVLRLIELEYDLTLHVVHVAGSTRMIAQGTDGLSREIFLEGVVRGEDMLSFVDLLRSAIERHPGVLEFVKSWVAPILGDSKVLVPEEWFREGLYRTVDTSTRRQWEGLHLDPPSCHRRCCTRRVCQVHSQAH